MTSELIFDVGLHDGEDTSLYLASGYDVVAIDANPEKCAAAVQRFQSEIASGRLEVLNVGIADPAEGDIPFWLSSYSHWSSFHRDNATKGGATATAIHVPTISFAELVSRYRTPFYVKIDVEGNDSFCLRELSCSQNLPEYVSFEAFPEASDDIAALSQAGYQEFNCIRQNDWREITPRNVRWQGATRKVIERYHHGTRIHYRGRHLDHDRYTPGSSGPLPWTFRRRWWKAEEIQRVWEHLYKVDRQLNAGGLGEWFDIHARNPGRR